jgi:hypothetical protein
VSATVVVSEEVRVPSKPGFRNQPARFGFASHSVTLHPSSNCKAAVNSASDLIVTSLFPLAEIYKGRQ